MVERPHVHVLFTFDFEEWEGKYEIYEADLYGKTKRVVDLLKHWEVPATFFLDAETILKYPEAAELLVQGGFELALHSDHHFGVSRSSLMKYDFSRQDSHTQVARMRNAIAMVRRVIPNFNPKGFRAPGLRWNEELYISLNKLNFLYDSSQGDKFVFWPFLKSGVVVMPVNSGDYDSSSYTIGAKYVVNNWRDNFRRTCRAAEKRGKSYFLLLAHPSVCGKYKYIGMLEAVLNYVGWSAAEYVTCADLATEYKTGEHKGEIKTLLKREIDEALQRRRTYIKEREARVKEGQAKVKEKQRRVLQLRETFKDYKARFRKDVEALREKAFESR